MNFCNRIANLYPSNFSTFRPFCNFAGSRRNLFANAYYGMGRYSDWATRSWTREGYFSAREGPQNEIRSWTMESIASCSGIDVAGIVAAPERTAGLAPFH